MSTVLFGCQHFERAGDCRAMADAVNPELSPLAINYKRFGPNSSEEFRNASKKYDAAANRLDSVHFKTPELTSLAVQLRENLRAAARSCDRLASSLGPSESARNNLASRELETQHQRHASLVASIDHACQVQ